jgi:23S rRNA (cytidine1920-2'-O)/16S rRNA (cytidine1409-2'-O)-methyltransferase
MGRRRRTPRRELEKHLRITRPDLTDPLSAIVSGLVRVDRRIVTNPRSLVPHDASIVVRAPIVLRGELKLRAALAAFDVGVAGRTALDLGAAAGGFTRALLNAGAHRVYAVDVGHGQLLGSLRQDPRVVTLEATNAAYLDRRRVPDVVDLVTVDLSYLAVAAVVSQLGGIVLAADADLIALVKPMFELGLASAPHDPDVLRRARERAARGAEGAGWHVVAQMKSPVLGRRGAIELLLHARRAARNSYLPVK